MEGVPGLAGVLTRSRPPRRCSAGLFNRIQFTPDLMPSDLVGARVYRPKDGEFDVGSARSSTATARRRDRRAGRIRAARVMQERRVTIGKQSLLPRRIRSS